VSIDPFDDGHSSPIVLVNQGELHSLWPTFDDALAGWRVANGEADRGARLDYIGQGWTDMRLKSLWGTLAGDGLSKSKR
jgi:uncharacterized protein YbdZ (MbtH family)